MNEIEKIIVLSGTLWLSAVAFIIYSWLIQVRQQQIFQFIAKRLIAIEKVLASKKSVLQETPVNTPQAPSEPQKTIRINKDEPLSKYETVTLPDEININFVDK